MSAKCLNTFQPHGIDTSQRPRREATFCQGDALAPTQGSDLVGIRLRTGAAVIAKMRMMSDMNPMASDNTVGVTIPSDRPILRTVLVDVHGQVADFVAELERGRPILKRCGVEAEVRAWQATYAGSDTGRIIVTLEFPDLAAFTRSEHAYATAADDPEFAAWARRLASIRRLTSDSLHIELAPFGER